MDESTPASKTCSKCGETKPLEGFHLRATSPDGRFGSCKACRKALDAARYAATVTDERRARNAEQRRRSVAALDDDARQEMKRRNREYMRRRYAERRDEILEKQNAARTEDPNRFREYGQRFREANPDKIREWNRQYRVSNVDRRSEIEHRRRARKRGTATGPVDLAALWTGDCGICRLPIDADLKRPEPMSKSLDHVIPLAKGGGHVQDNLQWTHLVCNLRKGAKLPA